MLKKPILPFLFAASVLAIQGCDNDSKSSSKVLSNPVSTSFTACVDNSNATASCDPSQAPQTASIQFDRAIKNVLFSPAYAAAVSGQTQFFLFYVKSDGTIDPDLAPAQASVSTTGLNDGFYRLTVAGDLTTTISNAIANDSFPVLLTDFNSSFSLTDITNSASLAGINGAQNALGFNTAFTLLSDIDDSDGDGISLDRISSDLSLLIISENLLATQTATTLNTFLDDTTALSITARGTNPDADLTTLVQNNQPEPDPTLQVFEDMTVSGTVSGSSGSTQTAATAAQGVKLSGVDIIVIGLNQAGTEIFRVVTKTDANGLFNINIPTVQNSTDSVLTRIEVTMQKDGYIVGEKVFKKGFESGAALSLRSLLGQETVVTQSRDQLAVTASGDRRFRLGLIQYENGEVAAVAGQQFADARASADSDTLLDMEIPEDCVPVETTAVTARVAYFDPNDQTDVQSFPGSFEGTGDDTAGGSGINLSGTSNDENYRLVSSVFSQVKLENQDGDNLTIDSNCGNTSGANAAAEGDAAVMTLNVPTESYDTITEDTDPNTAGVQVPIYIYSNGWKFAGNGTLVVLSGEDYDLYDGTIPPDVITTPDLFVQITVTEGNEWVKWVNLDWPIRPISEAQNLCLTGTINYDGQDEDDLEPFNGNLEIQSSTGWEWAYVDQGEVDFSTVLASGVDINSFTYQVWNQRSGQFEQLTPTDVDPPQEEGCDIELTFDATLENPLQCVVRGTITKSNGDPAPFFWFELNASDQFFNWGNSNNQGAYRVGTPCDLDATIYVAGQDFAVESDNYVDGEQTVNIQLENAAPEIWAFGPWRMINGRTALIDVFAFDVDGTVTGITATTCEGGTCTAPATPGGQFSYTPDTVGEHTLTFTATDDSEATNNTSSTSIVITVDPAGNKPPRINSFQVDGAFGGLLNGIIVGRNEFVEFREGDIATITVSAFDPDANPLSYAWTGCDTASTTNQCVVTTTSAGETVVSVTVTDQPTEGNPESKTASLTLLVQADEPPFIGSIFSTPAQAIDGGTGNIKDITFKAFVDDDFTAPENLTFSWNLVASDGSGTPITGSSAQLLVQSGTLEAGTYTVSVEVTDEMNNTSTRTTTYQVKGHKAPVIIVPDIKNVLTNENNNNAEDIFIFAEVTDDLTLAEQLDISWAVTGTEITATGNALEIPADTLPKGTYNAVVTVRDGPEGNEATKTATATVVINVISVPSDTDVIVQ
ncbi:Ig-like domain-containing protein [Litoribacillus peritrichatus]|uniref:PKD domain-containing protein n=1 Tax=Litoribacillus peritrichatus TaxID=718191 RepID=A0ABP7MQZ1_9GAMM